MSKIVYSYDHHAYVVELTKNDCESLMPVLKKAVGPMQKRYDYYKDIHEGGEATERQLDAMCKAEDTLHIITNILEDAKSLTGKQD